LVASPDPVIGFYVESPSGPLGTGHGFVQLPPDRGPQAEQLGGLSNLVYGHCPDGVLGKGQVKWDNTHPWDWKICFTVTVAQYQ